MLTQAASINRSNNRKFMVLPQEAQVALLKNMLDFSSSESSMKVSHSNRKDGTFSFLIKL